MDVHPSLVSRFVTPTQGLAWLVMLLVSDLPDIIWHWFGPVPGWLVWGKIGLLAALLITSLVIKPLRLLWQYFLIFLVFYLTRELSAWVGQTPWWHGITGGEQPTYTGFFLPTQLKELAEMVIMISAIWLLKRDRKAFFLDKGQLDAPLQPVRWLGIKAGERWNIFGWIFAAFLTGGITLYVVLSSIPLLGKFGQILTLLPFAVLFSAMNALSEEMTFRAPLLSTTHEPLGPTSALWLTSIFFGFAHVLHGDPPGMIGFVLTGFVAYLFGKSMLETRGSLWAWFIHFVSDIPIIILYALSMAK